MVGTVCAVGRKPVVLGMHAVDQLAYGVVIEIHVGDSGEQTREHYLIRLARRIHTLGGARQRDQRAGQLILKFGSIGAFAAHARIAHAAHTARCLLTLKTKHFAVH